MTQTLPLLEIQEFLATVAPFDRLSSQTWQKWLAKCQLLRYRIGQPILVRLPLSYFERRRTGELAGRINELESIRQFLTGTALTGTALTVVLDAVFSVIYIAVMLVYSWVLTIVALATVPLFALLTIFVSPTVRRQLRAKAERYADAQSYLVEVLSGIQTVKAQNIEMKSRWQWQERYARYIGAGFKTGAH